MAPFFGSLVQHGTYYSGDPEGDPEFDNHPDMTVLNPKAKGRSRSSIDHPAKMWGSKEPSLGPTWRPQSTQQNGLVERFFLNQGLHFGYFGGPGT